MKKFISGLLIGGIIMTSVSAFASNVVNMKAVYSVKNLIVNGVNTGKGSSAFISNGTTYVPLRTVSDALGHEISWDSKTRSIYINTGNKIPDTNGEPTDLPLADTGATTMPTTPNANSFNGQKLISMEAAKEAAIKAVGGGSVISQDADIYDDDDIPDYEFKIMKIISNGTTYVPLRTVSDALGHEISWDSKTRSIYINTGNKTPDTNGEPTDLPLADTGATTMPTTPNANISNGQKLISMEAAKEAAIKAVGGGSVISQDADIYDDDDIPDYEFKIMKNNKIYEVSINALTGAVIDFDID